jgi:beta-N-acetylhexosaminidase
MKFNIIVALILFAGITRANAQDRDSLDIKIGQMILIGIPGSEVDPQVLEEVRHGKAGSIIFFEKNIPRENPYIGLKKIAWTYQEAAPIPLFIAIDQEGGKVNRLKEKYGFPRSVSAAELGKAKSLDSVRFYGKITAATLAGLGINVNFAPVVDLASNPNNPIIAKVERSFSASADTVTMMAREFVRAHHEAGVMSVLKHFPGHGSSKDDTHLGIADVTKTWKVDELAPYQKLIKAGCVDAIMTAHIVNRNLDYSGLPGTLSKKVIDSLLRKKIGFQGVVFSDDMQMHAITKHYGLEESIRMAINAGVDILCFSNNIYGSADRTVDKVHQIIKSYVASGAIAKDRVDESYDRIMLLKKKLSNESEYLNRNLAQTEKELAKAEASYDSLLQLSIQQNEELEVLKKQQSSDKRRKRSKNRDN